MTKRLVDIDDELLAQAREILSASTMKEAINSALESVVRAAHRRRHLDRLRTRAGLDLAGSEIMGDAWG